MKRIDLWKTQLKAALAEMKIRTRDANAAARTVARLDKIIVNLERKIHDYLAKS